MRVIDSYAPISPTRYITLEHEEVGLSGWPVWRVYHWRLQGMDYQPDLIGSSPKTNKYGYLQRGSAYKYFKRYLAWCSAPITYERTQLSQLGLLHITGWAHHPLSASGVDVLFFTLAEGTVGWCDIGKSI